MNVSQFIKKYVASTLKEEAVAQQHFLDLCALLQHPCPADVDATGDSFTFEKHVGKTGGGKGFADVWKRGFFGWEYKGKHKDTKAAYLQLLQYRESLENPPLLVVCDIDTILVHTNFTNTPHLEYRLPLAELDQPQNLDILRAVFFDPGKLKPGVTRETITRNAAMRLAQIAQGLRDRGQEPRHVARFLDRLIFCMFAEDIDLLPNRVFSRLAERYKSDAAKFSKNVADLFDAMAHGGDVFLETIPHFNGSLFNESPVLDLTTGEIEAIRQAAELDWGAVDPSILGTLFERGLDPAKRSQLGAHYTSREDIELLVEPVVMQPLRREWETAREEARQVLSGGRRDAARQADRLLHNFLTRLGTVTVLDPACGSGNFLYVTLQKLKDLEKEVIDFALSQDFSAFFPEVGPWQLFGLEVSAYAADLAQMTVWIGYLQWLREHGYPLRDTPILRTMDNIQCRDAVLDLSDLAQAKESGWPAVEFIVGNPPFLGDKMMRGKLGDAYVEALRKQYAGRLPGQSDLCCYWFEKARQQIAAGNCKRAGLLATQGIRNGLNRETLKRIQEGGGIFFAVSDRNWILDGANVHVSMVGFDNGQETIHILDGQPVAHIHSNLSGGGSETADVTQARPLTANAGVCFLGVMKAGAFDVEEAMALAWLPLPNLNGRPNSDVLRPRLTARDILQRSGKGWIIDFGCDREEADGAQFESPWEHIVKFVKPEREGNRRSRMAAKWWLHGESRPGLRRALAGLPRFLVTPEVSKHRVFVWLDAPYLADHKTRAFARADDYAFGVLHSRVHELWARAQGSQLRERESGFSYTPSACFDTFPFPTPTPEQEAAIAEAARELDRLRSRWLNPPEWTREEILTFPGAIDGAWARYVSAPNADGIGTVRWPRLVPSRPEHAAPLAARTLTSLYNQRPAWLDMAHRKLDEAVFAAYNWPTDLPDPATLAALLALNHENSE